MTLLRGFRFLSDLKTVLRSSPRHSNDEQNAIRGLASLHPAIPRKVARLRARFVDRDAAGSAAAAGPEDSLFSEQEVQRCLAALKEDGVYIFSQRLSQPMVASLKSALATVPAYFRTETGDKTLFRPGIDQAGLFDFHEDDLMKQHAIQEYSTHSTWQVIAARYFDAPPVHDETVAWWTFPQPAEFASQNAQLFHSDRRRLSFVKFFTYLTDVTSRNGPHVVVPGTHRERRMALRPDRRYEDAEVLAGCRKPPLEALGAAGTVIAVDTQALHKGKMMEEGSRLMLEIQFATDLLGPPSSELRKEWSATTKRRIEANPRMFQRFR